MGAVDRKEASRLVGVRITTRLRETFSKSASCLYPIAVEADCRHLMTDSKSRKVIVLENTYLPAYVKEHFAQALFENLKVGIELTPSRII